MPRRESSIASRQPTPPPPATIFDARRTTWTWPKSAPNCRQPVPRSKWRDRSSVCQEAQVTSQGQRASAGGSRRIGVLEGTPRRSGPAGPGGRRVVLRGGAPQPRPEMVRRSDAALPTESSPIRARPKRKPRPGISWRSASRTSSARNESPSCAERTDFWNMRRRKTGRRRDWFAQIVNSLAKELSKGTADERSEAKRLFEYRLQLDDERQLGDLRGVGHGGGRIGPPGMVHASRRTSLPPKSTSAETWKFPKRSATSSPRSRCTACSGPARWKKAISNRPWPIISGPGNWPAIRSTAASPPSVCSAATNDRIVPINSRAWRKQLLDLLEREKIPSDCQSQLQAVLKTCAVESRGETVRKLWDLTQQ